MPPRSPASKLYTGKPGRPRAVRAFAQEVIARHLQFSMEASGMLPELIPLSVRRKVCREIAIGITFQLKEAGLHIMPAKLAHEFALLAGEAPNARDSQAPVVASKDRSS